MGIRNNKAIALWSSVKKQCLKFSLDSPENNYHDVLFH